MNAAHTAIFRTAGRFIVPVALLISFYLFFKGHQTPGGGFVGGLTAAVALILYRMSEGPWRLERLAPVPERWIIGLGLLLAGGTGAAALAFGLPFLSSNFGYVELPRIPGTAGLEAEWATVLLFDLGVMLVVAGTVVGLINALGDEVQNRLSPWRQHDEDRHDRLEPTQHAEAQAAHDPSVPSEELRP